MVLGKLPYVQKRKLRVNLLKIEITTLEGVKVGFNLI
jgi:hypothetical protein